jgi:hypothetical protein
MKRILVTHALFLANVTVLGTLVFIAKTAPTLLFVILALAILAIFWVLSGEIIR